MAKKKLDLSKPIDVPVSPSGLPTKTNGFIRAAQDTSLQRFRSTGAAMREQFRMLMAQAKDRASGLPVKDRQEKLNEPLEMGGVVPVTIDQSKVGDEVYQWSDRTPNSRLNQKLKQHLIDSDYVATKASTGHYAKLAQNEITYKNNIPTYSDLGNHFLRVHAGNHQAEVNRLSDLIDKNDPQTILEHAAAAGVRVFHDTTSIGSHRVRVLVAPGVYEKGEAKRFTNDASTPITATQDVDSLPEAARYEKKKN